MSELKRSDNQYVEVEEFADYELTQCIAYEMMARESYHKELADEVVNYYNDNKDSIETCLKKNSSDGMLATKQSDGSTKIEIIEKNNIQELDNLLELTLLINAIPLLKFEDLPLGYKDPRLGDDFWHIKDKMDRYHGYVEFQPFQDTELIKDRHGDYISVIRREYREGYFIETELPTYIETEEEEQINNLNEYARYLNREDLYGTTSNIIVIQSPKRPEVPTEKFKTISPELTVNLNRPLKETIALITHIKEDMEENKLIKLPIELLGMELKRADNLVCNDKGEKCFDPRGILSTQQKMADMFYIYDCLKEGYTKRKIQNEVYNYYADKGLENITLDQKTLNKYQRIAIDYIDNRKYKEMLTGVSIDDLRQEFG